MWIHAMLVVGLLCIIPLWDWHRHLGPFTLQHECVLHILAIALHIQTTIAQCQVKLEC